MSPASRNVAAAVAALAAAAALALAGAPPALAQKPGAKKLNKFTGDAQATKEGRALYLKYGCAGCHGVGGGGGMGPPITDDAWRFGSDDETLFKLIKGEIAEQKMPKVFAALPEEEVWKMIAYVRSVYAGDPAKVDW